MGRPFVKDLQWPRVSELPNGRWLVDTGKRTAQRVRKKFPTEKEAREYAKTFERPFELDGKAALTELQRREHLLADHLLKDNGLANVSVVDAVRHYLKFVQLSGNSPNIRDAMARMLAERSGRYRDQLRFNLRDFVDAHGDKKPASITPDEVQAAIKKPKGIAATTRHNLYSALRTFFSYCKEAEWLEKSPVRKSFAPKVTEFDPQILTIKDAEKLMRATPDHMRVFMALALFCGIRIQELCRLKFSDIAWNDYDKGWIVLISPAIGKKNRARNVPVPANAEAWIINRAVPKGGMGNVFYGPHTPNPPYIMPERCEYVMPGKEGGVSYRIREIAKTAGVKLSQNVMRHSFASYYFELTRDAEQTRYRLGHNTPDVLFTHYRQLVARATTNPFGYFHIWPNPADLQNHLNEIGQPRANATTASPAAFRMLHLL